MYFKKVKNGTEVHLKVVPNAAKNEFCGVILDEYENKLLRVRISAIPDGGKANKELLKFLSKEWKIPRSSMQIISGKTARRKIILIENNVNPVFV